jgi:hypothetical protein
MPTLRESPVPTVVEQVKAFHREPHVHENTKVGQEGLPDWKDGFHAGIMRLLATYSEDWAKERDLEKEKVLPLAQTKGTHDLGFLLLPALRDAKDPQSIAALIHGAETLKARFDPKRRAIRAWDWKAWQYPVIIDTMPNLELLFLAARAKEIGKDTSLTDVAEIHAETTWNTLVRPDGSTRHICELNPEGVAYGQGTGQGAENESTWSRGQAWALYGWATLAEWTKSPKDINRAKKLAAYVMKQTKSSKIPPWDYSLPGDPKDESAAAINAAGFARLSRVTEEQIYRQEAEAILHEIAKTPSQSRCGYRTTAVRSWETVHLPPEGSPVGDYYLMEAANILRPPKSPTPATAGVGKITTIQEKEGQNLVREGLFCLTGPDSGLTVSHILEKTSYGKVELGGETYKVKSWTKRTRPHPENWTSPAEMDLALVTLEREPPADLPRWPVSTTPPENDNFLILTSQDSHLEWTMMAPRMLDGYQVAAMTPRKGYSIVRAMLNLAPTWGPALSVGDSGGPWIQNGKLVAVTSRISGETRAIKQTAYGAGTWENPAVQWAERPQADHRWLLVALGSLLVAKVLANRRKRNQK